MGNDSEGWGPVPTSVEATTEKGGAGLAGSEGPNQMPHADDGVGEKAVGEASKGSENAESTDFRQRFERMSQIRALRGTQMYDDAVYALGSFVPAALLMQFDEIGKFLFLSTDLTEDERNLRIISAIYKISRENPRDEFEKILLRNIISVEAAIVKLNTDGFNLSNVNTLAKLYQLLDQLIGRFDKHRRKK